MPHINQLIDFTVEVFIVYKNKVLLRRHDKYGIWLSVGGHVELDEDPNQAALREVKEEVGLDIVLDNSLQDFKKDTKDFKELIPPRSLNRHKINEHHEHVTMVYFGVAKSDNVKQEIDREKSNNIKWFNKQELEENNDIIDNVKFYALKALEVLTKQYGDY